MYRCAICNYTANEGSDLLDKAPNFKNTVRWDDAYKGFLCSDCRKSINSTTQDFQIRE